MLVVPFEITLTGNYIVAFLAFVREERDAVANPTARAFPTDSHHLESSFPHAARRSGYLVPTTRRDATRRVATRRASRCYTFSTGQDKFFLLCSAGTRFAIVLYGDTSYGRTGEFCSQRVLRFSPSTM